MFEDGWGYHVYRRRWWAFVYPGYWIDVLRDPLVNEICRQIVAAQKGKRIGKLRGYLKCMAAILDIEREIVLPIWGGNFNEMSKM